jgi:hypothetical protein
MFLNHNSEKPALIAASNDQVYDLVLTRCRWSEPWGRGESNPYWLEPKSTTCHGMVSDLGERRIPRANL